MSAYYNEIDPYAAQWLRNLIKAGHIADGEVDERSIEDVRPDDLRGFTQCHFFAGIGVWSYALRLAGWPDEQTVWTGSCPCQPFSTAGRRAGFADKRHLWPSFYHLIRECEPAIVLGEQVASKDGLNWLATVRSDMESFGHAFGAADLCAAGVGAPHIRQRLFFVSYATGSEARPQVISRRISKTGGGQAELPSPTGRPAGLHGAAHWLSEPAICRVVDGYPGVVEQLHAYGNAISSYPAKVFIESVVEAIEVFDLC